jgi:hypothetical protein
MSAPFVRPEHGQTTLTDVRDPAVKIASELRLLGLELADQFTIVVPHGSASRPGRSR